MWEALALIGKMALDKNGSPAWKRINNTLNMFNKINSFKNSARKQSITYTGAVDRTGMYGAYGG